MTRIALPTKTPAARITECGEVVIDKVTYIAHHVTGDVWAFQLIGKRGKPISQYRPGRVVNGEIVTLRSATRF